MEKTAEKLKVNESLLKTVLCSATFWGLLAHGMVLFNKYSFHDTHSMMMYGISMKWALLTNLDGGCWAFLEV